MEESMVQGPEGMLFDRTHGRASTLTTLRIPTAMRAATEGLLELVRVRVRVRVRVS
jgi:hypothetical protein